MWRSLVPSRPGAPPLSKRAELGLVVRTPGESELPVTLLLDLLFHTSKPDNQESVEHLGVTRTWLGAEQQAQRASLWRLWVMQASKVLQIPLSQRQRLTLDHTPGVARACIT